MGKKDNAIENQIEDNKTEGNVPVFREIEVNKGEARLIETVGVPMPRAGELFAKTFRDACNEIVTVEHTDEPIKKFRYDFEVCNDRLDETIKKADNEETALQALKVVLDEQTEELRKMMWSGSSNDGEINGFLNLFSVENIVTIVEGESITTENVQGEIKKALTSLPKELRKNPLIIAMSINVYNAYAECLHPNITGIENAGKYTIEATEGLPDNNMVISEPNNLVLKTNTEWEGNAIRVIPGEQSTKGSLVYTIEAKVKNPQHIVHYKPKTE